MGNSLPERKRVGPDAAFDNRGSVVCYELKNRRLQDFECAVKGVVKLTTDLVAFQDFEL